ncbi:TetR/AcrR family transcriptional regulator [Streptomonospora wellingtoniae]|uniref:Helix-turn-helix domain-containing protein n=1 Tax=Streptomonospora wellingtoniae TaxID=3075544 RepID=A0ABU2KRW5_9ACTN|nr:helix-turn-helix domain-containing protein [Streptomonospora sp. DSM 45055]MDT0302020.1 helix-turn-helix domain-containing protein [Streptomonospora sp. DSM 45055]
MPNPTEAADLSGRRAQAARNDSAIVDAARAVFLDDPKAPVSAVAARAGVGISALYRRYGGKEDLLRQVCHDGLRRYIAEAEQALAEDDDWQAFTSFLFRIVDADVHSLTVHLAGSFEPTAEMGADAARSGKLAERLTRRGHQSGRLRSDFTPADIVLVLEGCAALRFPDPERTRRLRRRYLALQLAGLDTAAGAAQDAGLPGPPASEEELGWRWRR